MSTAVGVAEALLAEAQAATGLSDFGPDGFREGLEVYCDSAFREAQLSDLGVLAVRGNIVANLVNRLKVVDHAVRHPEVRAERIDAPLFVIGMFRAGTTLLSNLLDRDPGNRALIRWESMDSVPPPTAADARRGPRVEAARIGADVLEQLNPAMKSIHHEEVDGPTECIAVMAQDFKSLSWEAIANVPAYGRWLLGADQRSAYDYHRLVLQVLQSGGVRGRWTLKSPHHAIALDALTAVYPDARLVLLHRDPAVLCGSVFSLISTLSGTFTDADHRRYIAEHWTEVLAASVERIDRFRDAHPEHAIVDVQYADLVADPVGTVARIYAAGGDELGNGARAAMQAYCDAHRRGKDGVHTYDLATFGLERAAVRERFAGYSARYAVPEEPGR
ncbi:MAG TPA: sulfotransferase [Mycobacteriales bacterium]|nr:sulfotransferase [Mycobacteriales bacterium]